MTLKNQGADKVRSFFDVIVNFFHFFQKIGVQIGYYML